MEFSPKNKKMDNKEIEAKLSWSLIEVGDFVFISDLKISYDEVVAEDDVISVEDIAPKEQIFAWIASRYAEENDLLINGFQFLGDRAVFLMW